MQEKQEPLVFINPFDDQEQPRDADELAPWQRNVARAMIVPVFGALSGAQECGPLVQYGFNACAPAAKEQPHIELGTSSAAPNPFNGVTVVASASAASSILSVPFRMGRSS